MFDKAPAGTLNVTLIEASELKREDFNGSDAFVELWMDKDYKQKSNVMENNNNPVWNQSFSFSVEEGSRDHKLYFKVYDEDAISNDKIGDGDVDVRPAFKGEQLDIWAKLPSLMGLSNHGTCEGRRMECQDSREEYYKYVNDAERDSNFVELIAL
ncbi:C2-domain-containing protein [Backusella circina FSU 941]|nr:C2-domain-containing protein [Backusella circina FSU 941]